MFWSVKWETEAAKRGLFELLSDGGLVVLGYSLPFDLFIPSCSSREQGWAELSHPLIL